MNQPNWDFAEPMEKPHWLDGIVAVAYMLGVFSLGLTLLSLPLLFLVPFLGVSIVVFVLFVFGCSLLSITNRIERGILPRIELLATLVVVSGTVFSLATIYLMVDSYVVATFLVFPTSVILLTGTLAFSIRNQYATWQRNHQGHRALDRWCEVDIIREILDRQIPVTIREWRIFQENWSPRTQIFHGISCRILT